MGVAAFLLDSFAATDLTVGHPAFESTQDDAPIREALERLDTETRLNAPGAPPALDEAVAVWAARLTYGLAQALAYRELGDDVVQRLLNTPCPVAATDVAAYSADLSLCLLPDLHRLASAASHDDPLTLGLLNLGRQWPLSSVGMPGVGVVDVDGFFDHPSLRREYVDRVITRHDTTRLADARVAAAVEAALGVHRSLAPIVALELDRRSKGN